MRAERTTPLTGNSLKHRKENLTPRLGQRQSFVKPKKQVFADFGVQVFAGPPRAMSPETEKASTATPIEV